MIITIDGPSASGKSTIARLLAQELGYFYLNTGMLYRGFAYAVLEEHIDYTCITSSIISELLSKLHYTWQSNAAISFNRSDITPFLESVRIDQAASCISALPLVRRHIDAWQHALVENLNAVIDGRDSGSVVFAHAEHKFYVTAADEVRAQRWLGKQREQGKEYTLAQALEQIQKRDQRDMQRSVAPLVIPQGALVICNDGDNPKDAVYLIMQTL